MPPRGGLRRVRARHEPPRRDRRVDPAGAAAHRGDHDDRAGASRNFSASVEAIADAKAEIFLGSSRAASPSSTATTRIYARLAAAAIRVGAEIVGLAPIPRATVRLPRLRAGAAAAARSRPRSPARTLRFRLNVPGRHWVDECARGAGRSRRAGCDPQPAAEALAALEALPGRGRCHRSPWRGGNLTLIDESYNASPAAMLAALAVLGATPRRRRAAGGGARRHARARRRGRAAASRLAATANIAPRSIASF